MCERAHDPVFPVDRVGAWQQLAEGLTPQNIRSASRDELVGRVGLAALEHIKSLIEAARAKGLPVIYTTGERRADNWDAGSWRWKSMRGDEASCSVHDDIDGNEIVTMIAPGPRDIVIKKQKPSGFFGTDLGSYLTLLGCDSVIVVGTTTSGCVRATVVDAFSLNYRVILASCFDRSEARAATRSTNGRSCSFFTATTTNFCSTRCGRGAARQSPITTSSLPRSHTGPALRSSSRQSGYWRR